VKISPADPEILQLQANKSAKTQYLLAMATSLEIMKKIFQIYYLHPKLFHMV